MFLLYRKEKDMDKKELQEIYDEKLIEYLQDNSDFEAHRKTAEYIYQVLSSKPCENKVDALPDLSERRSQD